MPGSASRASPSHERRLDGAHQRAEAAALPAPERGVSGFSVTPVAGLPELREGDDPAGAIVERIDLADGDVVVVAQKAISKVEGRITALLILDGEKDPAGYELHATRIALADQIAGAAQLVFGKLDRVPVAVVRGLDVAGDQTAAELVIPPETDLFR